MLIEFRVENFRSIGNEQVFTMEAGRIDSDDNQFPRQIHGHQTPILPVSAVYGANASGKSNFVSAIGFMRDAVVHSHRVWSPDAGVPRVKFRWGLKKTEPSLFEITFLIDGVRYQYGFVANDECFLEEWLYAWPTSRKQTWFERDKDKFKFGDKFPGENRLIEQLTRPNSLFLSTAVQNKHPGLMPIYKVFSHLLLMNVGGRKESRMPWLNTEQWLSRKIGQGFSHQLNLFSNDIEKNFEAFRKLLQEADIGIVDFKIEKNNDDEMGLSKIMVRHQFSGEDAWLPLKEESQGTLTLFRMAPLLLDMLSKGGVIVIDELESSLHPVLAFKIVNLFNDPETNPKNAQLIFTTHDTNLLGTLMGEPILRRDQVWFTEKDKDGATRLYPLTDYKPRKAENLERGYLQGRYGAIPFIGDLFKAKEKE